MGEDEGVGGLPEMAGDRQAKMRGNGGLWLVKAAGGRMIAGR